MEGLTYAIVQFIINYRAPVFWLFIGHRMNRNTGSRAWSGLTRHWTSRRTTGGVHGLGVVVRGLIARWWGATGQLVATTGVWRRPRIGLLGMGHVRSMWASWRAGVRPRRGGIGTGAVGLLTLIIASSSLTGGGNLESQRRIELNREKMSEVLRKEGWVDCLKISQRIWIGEFLSKSTTLQFFCECEAIRLTLNGK